MTGGILQKIHYSGEQLPLTRGFSSCTISRYITHCIQESGVITGSHNMGHTARGVAASMAAFKGLSTQEIMNDVEWKSEMTVKTLL